MKSLLLVILILLFAQILFLGKNSFIVKILKNLGLPGITAFLHLFFSRDSILVRGVKSMLSAAVTFLHGLFSYRKGYNDGYQDAVNKRSKHWLSRWWR